MRRVNLVTELGVPEGMKVTGSLAQDIESHDRSTVVAFKSSQWTAVWKASANTITSPSAVIPTMRTLCPGNNLVSRVTSLIPPIARVTTLVSSVARIATALVLLIIVVRGIILGVTLHLLTVVEVLAFGLDKLVGFCACETGEDIFGHGVIFGNTYMQRNVSAVL